MLRCTSVDISHSEIAQAASGPTSQLDVNLVCLRKARPAAYRLSAMAMPSAKDSKTLWLRILG